MYLLSRVEPRHEQAFYGAPLPWPDGGEDVVLDPVAVVSRQACLFRRGDPVKQSEQNLNTTPPPPTQEQEQHRFGREYGEHTLLEGRIGVSDTCLAQRVVCKAELKTERLCGFRGASKILFIGTTTERLQFARLWLRKKTKRKVSSQ